MAEHRTRVTDRQIILPVLVSMPLQDAASADGDSWRALLDTGAGRTMITQNIVTKLHLSQVSTSMFQTASGALTEAKVYRIRVTPTVSDPPGVPAAGKIVPFPRGCDVDALLLPHLPRGFDVLLGMDVVLHFHLTVHNHECIIRS